ncbi:MAG: hypothetical protein AAGC99_09965 [Pseudomonadota bacterium]
MTYLATEMLLYMLSTALIGLILGWMIWGLGQRRRLRGLRDELTAVIEQEKDAHDQTRKFLEESEANGKKALKAAALDANRSMNELKETIEAERLSVRDVQSELESVRAGIDATIEADRASVQANIDQAIETANAERAAASEAMAKEAQSRAQIEELRLLIGAEKLAAENARAELEDMRRSLSAELETERTAHEQAKIALNDIRSTLARTLGASTFDVAGDGGAAQDTSSSANAVFGQAEEAEQANGLNGSSARAATAFNMMTDVAAAGDALNNPDLDEADIEDREGVSLDLPSTIETVEMPAEGDHGGDDSAPPKPPHGGMFRPTPTEAIERKRPMAFLDQRPDDIDDLLAIDGISPEIEGRLHDCGCYRYDQLADLSTEDIAWLADEIGLSSFQIASDRWIEQAKALGPEKDAKDDHEVVEESDRQNATG